MLCSLDGTSGALEFGLARIWVSSKPSTRGQTRALTELGKQKWGSKLIRVPVESGAVTPPGAILDECERQAPRSQPRTCRG